MANFDENNCIPPNIVKDLALPNTSLRLAPGWVCKKGVNRLWLYHENHDSIDFDLNGSAAAVIELIGSSIDVTVGDVQASVAQLWLETLLSLWGVGVLRLGRADSEEGGRNERSLIKDDQERYIWRNEYFDRYASPSRPISMMAKELSSSTVCIIGLGGLGSTLALALSATGIGRLKLVDGDTVERSNLSRQILYSEETIGKLKVDVMRSIVLRNNSSTRVETEASYVFSAQDAYSMVDGSDLVILCADQPRFSIRDWVGKACVAKSIPHLFMTGAWVGPLSVPGVSPCYACVGRFHGARISDVAGFIENLSNSSVPPRASFGPRPLIVAGFMASLIIKYLAGVDRDTPLHRRFRVDTYGNMEEEKLVRYKNCAVCGSRT